MLSVILLAGVGTAQAQSLSFNIPSERLSDALRDYGRASSRQIIFTEDLVAGRTSPELRGSFTAEQALERLLEGSGLVAEQTPSGSIMIRRPRSGSISGEGRGFAGEEIIVTAQKRETSLRTTPLSVTALTGKSLEARGAENLADYYRSIPGLYVMDLGPNQKNYVMRGMQTDVNFNSSTVAVYIDDVPGAEQIDPQLFDIERVEALRGPQGTLYGASSMAGAIRILTKKPDATKVEAAFKTRLATTPDGGDSYGVNAMLNVPIVENRLALRVVGYRRHAGGFIDHQYAGADVPAVPPLDNPDAGLFVPGTPAATIPPIHEKNANTLDVTGGRVGVRWFATDAFTATATVLYENSRLRDGQYDQPETVGPYRNGQSIVQGNSQRSFIGNLTLQYDFDWASLTSVTSLLQQRTIQNSDGELLFQGPPFDRFAGPGTVSMTNPKKQRNVTQELRLASKSGGPFDYVVGAYYSDARNGTHQMVFRQFDRSNPSLNTLTEHANDIRELSVFGELTYQINEQWQVTFGTRRATVKTASEPSVDLSNLPPALITPTFSLHSSETKQTYKFNVAYKANENIFVYALASEGFRPGGSNAPDPTVPIPSTYRSDSLWNYEVGLKTAWFDNRMTLNATAYYIDWSNLQVTSYVQTNGYIGNAGKAHTAGLEIEWSAIPFKGLTLTASGSFLEAKLDEDQPFNPTLPFGTDSAGRKGDRLPGVPQTTVTLSAQYERPLTDNLTGSVRADYSYVGGSYTRFNNFSPERTRLHPYALLNLRFGIAGDSNWSCDLFIDNLTDKRADLNIYQLLGGTKIHTPNRPRTIGLEFSKNF